MTNEQMVQDKILIVDDEETVVFLLKKLLNKNYTIETASNGKEGLAKVKSFEPDIILLDIMMPEISGIEVCRQLQNDPETTDIPVIMVTAKTEEEDIEAGLSTGAVDYVCKPFSEIELKARIKSALRLKHHIDMLKKLNKEKIELIGHLKNALLQVKTISGFIPQCSICGKVRNEFGEWSVLDESKAKTSKEKFTKTICPECSKKISRDDIINNKTQNN